MKKNGLVSVVSEEKQRSERSQIFHLNSSESKTVQLEISI